MDPLADNSRTAHSEHLLALGRRLALPYAALPTARAAMITGSAAEGVSDAHSDLDMTIYYEGELPAEEQLAAIRVAHGAPEREWLIGDRQEGAIAEAYELDGIQVQIGHTTIARWEQDIAEVVDRFNCDTPLHKAMSGTLECVPVAGHALVDRWKARIAAYPDGLREAMVQRHLQIFPIWYLPHVEAARDAALWHRQTLVEGAFNLLGVLAGLNRRYFSPFQFKKMRRFLADLPLQPEQCAERLEALALSPAAEAAAVYERLVADIVSLVQEHLPGVDVTAAARRIGQRRQPWTLRGRSVVP